MFVCRSHLIPRWSSTACYLVNVKTVIVDIPLKTILSERIARLPLLLINGNRRIFPDLLNRINLRKIRPSSIKSSITNYVTPDGKEYLNSILFTTIHLDQIIIPDILCVSYIYWHHTCLIFCISFSKIRNPYNTGFQLAILLTHFIYFYSTVTR